MAKDLEFDWDNKESTAQAEIRKVDVVPVPKKIQSHGTTLAIPVGKNKWKAIDIAHTSPEEFVNWVLLTYPIVDKKDLNPSDFTDLARKLRTYENIVKFHQDSKLLQSESSKLVKKE